MLFDLESICLAGGIVLGLDVHFGCTRLCVPALELRQIDPVGIFHGFDEVITGDGLAIMAGEI